MSEKHYGHFVEYAVRKNGFSMIDLAKSLKVSRKTVYNWFAEPKLNARVIYRIGILISINFSIDFPELFTDNQYGCVFKVKSESIKHLEWKKKYVTFLERFNILLIKDFEGGSSYLLN